MANMKDRAVRTTEEGCTVTNEPTDDGETVTMECPVLERIARIDEIDDLCYDESGIPWGMSSPK